MGTREICFDLWRAEPARKVSQLLGSIWFYTFGMWFGSRVEGHGVSPKNEAQVSCKKEESEDGTGEMKTVCTQGTPKVQTLYSFVMLDLCALLSKWSIVQKYRPRYGNQKESLLKTKMSILLVVYFVYVDAPRITFPEQPLRNAVGLQLNFCSQFRYFSTYLFPEFQEPPWLCC